MNFRSDQIPPHPWSVHSLMQGTCLWRVHGGGGGVDGWFRADSCHQKSEFWWIQHWTVINDPCVFVKEDIWDISLQIHLFPSSPSLLMDFRRLLRHRAREWKTAIWDGKATRWEEKKFVMPKKYPYKYHNCCFHVDTLLHGPFGSITKVTKSGRSPMFWRTSCWAHKP